MCSCAARSATKNGFGVPVYPLIGFHPDFELFTRIGNHIRCRNGRPQDQSCNAGNVVPGVHVAGVWTAGTRISEIFIENGRFDGEKIFGSAAERQRAQTYNQGIRRDGGVVPSHTVSSG